MRPDLSESEKTHVVEAILQTQEKISRVQEEDYNVAYLVCLLVAAGYSTPSSLPLPVVDVRLFLPADYPLPEGITTTANVAPISRAIEDKVDAGGSSDLDRLLSAQHLKQLHTQLLSMSIPTADNVERRVDSAAIKHPTFKSPPVSHWKQQRRKFWDEITRLSRKDFAEVAAQPRINAILMRLRRLDREMLQRGISAPSTILPLEERQRQALYIKTLDLDTASDQRESDHAGDEELNAAEGIGLDLDLSVTDDLNLDSDEADDLDLNEEHVPRLAIEEDWWCGEDDEIMEQGDVVTVKTTDDNDVDEAEGQEEDEETNEYSGAQIKRLFSVVNTLVHSPSIKHDINNNYVQKCANKTTVISTRDAQAIKDVTNILRKYCPKKVIQTEGSYKDPRSCLALSASLVLLAQAIFPLLGLSRFTRRLSSWPSAGSLGALHLDSCSIYEIMCTSSPDQFDAVNGNIISNSANAYRQENRNTLISHGADRQGYPTESAYEQRRQNKNIAHGFSFMWQQELDHWGMTTPEISTAVKMSTQEVKEKAKNLKDAKKQNSNVDPTDIEVEKDNSSAPKVLQCHWDNHKLEETPERINLQHMLQEVQHDPSKKIACGGGDPGLVTTLDVVPQTLEEVFAHLNQFQQLSGQVDEESDDVVEGALEGSTDDVQLDDDQAAVGLEVRFPRATRVSSANLKDISFTHQFLKNRQGVVHHNQDIQAALSELSSDSLHSAKTIQDIDRISEKRRAARQPLQLLHRHPRLQRRKHTQRLRKKRAKTKEASRIRDAIQWHAKTAHQYRDQGSLHQVNSYNGWCTTCGHHQPCNPASKILKTVI
ncbi:hypothetical protein BG004_004254 [Podila humilis]|nr:hypothetical protein BG004_004254 [Podila humilis]